MANRKALPITPAKRISFGEDHAPAEPYYTDQQKRELEAHKKEFKGTDRIASHSMESSDEEEEAYERRKKPPKRGFKPLPPRDDLPPKDEEEKESKGLLAKVVDAGAKVADAAKSVVSTKEEKKKIVETHLIIELPRDILTAFFLLRLPRDESRRKVKKGTVRPPFWDDYSMKGHIMLWIAVLLPYSVQWFVLFVLVRDLMVSWDVLKDDDAGKDFWFNTCAFAVLFLYMWKDAITFYCSVWKYISWLQRDAGGIMGNIASAASSAKEVAKSVTLDADDVEKEIAKEVAKEAVEETKTVMRFVEFRIWLITVILLYVGLTCYSLLKIPLAGGDDGGGLVDKLEVSLSIFFVLEVDDWAYQLFIAQANILEDEEFDVVIKVQKDRKAVVKDQEKHLSRTIFLVIGSISLFWVLGWAFNHL